MPRCARHICGGCLDSSNQGPRPPRQYDRGHSKTPGLSSGSRSYKVDRRLRLQQHRNEPRSNVGVCTHSSKTTNCMGRGGTARACLPASSFPLRLILTCVHGGNMYHVCNPGGGRRASCECLPASGRLRSETSCCDVGTNLLVIRTLVDRYGIKGLLLPPAGSAPGPTSRLAVRKIPNEIFLRLSSPFRFAILGESFRTRGPGNGIHSAHRL